MYSFCRYGCRFNRRTDSLRNNILTHIMALALLVIGKSQSGCEHYEHSIRGYQSCFAYSYSAVSSCLCLCNFFYTEEIFLTSICHKGRWTDFSSSQQIRYTFHSESHTAKKSEKYAKSILLLMSKFVAARRFSRHYLATHQQALLIILSTEYLLRNVFS